MFIMFPWAATRLWNSRWNAMSFGPLQFRADVTAAGLKARWALVYLVPIGLFLLAMVVAMVAAAGTNLGQPSPVGISAALIGFILLFYIGIPLLTLHWFAGFFRKAAEATTLGELEFEFDATTLQWLGLFLGNVALAIVTLGFGLTYWGYRNWAFMVRHMQVYGTIDVLQLTQSTTFAPREAEGFADAFDVGAI
jgi:uncharacterized membrane protein YjgN (DUF898 family)